MPVLTRRAFAALPLAAVAAGSARAQTAGQPRTRFVFWHAMTGPLTDEVNRLCAAFNAAHPTLEVEPVFKGQYPETLTAAIAAWRAGQAPHLVQMFEVGTGSMLAAGPAVKPVWQLIQETGVEIDPAAYIGAVRGYYSLPDGRLASMPFNSSTAIMYVNQDAFRRAGLDPASPPATWPALVEAARTLKARGEKPVTTSWFSWIQLEQFAALHDLPFATKANGFEGLDTQLQINTAPFIGQLQRFLDMQKEGTFRYAGRDSAPEPLFASGDASISFMSSGSRAEVSRNAKFAWAPAPLPYDPALRATPLNSVIGGASLWTMTAPNRTPAEYKAVAEFLRFIATPRNAADWSERTGYVPVTRAGYEQVGKDGYYDKNPGADVAIRQLLRTEPTANSRGFRLGRMAELRNIQYEEVERALQGQQDAKAALDNAVARGNRVLRDFERQNKA